MTKYERLLARAENEGTKVLELDLGTNKECGKYFDNIIIINSNMRTIQKYCILSEELGHHHKTVGDITNQTKIENKKQELIARRWGYEKLVGIVDLLNAHNHGCKTRYEIADYLCVTESFLEETIEYYKCKYGMYYEIDNYLVYFEPNLGIFEKF
ncbi:MAG: ImmA/IrrE family metallo-endopeptidase [Clostridium sp.]